METIRTITTDKAVYTIETETRTRMTYSRDGEQIPKTYFQHNILKDGKMVRFCFDQADIMDMIHVEENPEQYAGIGSRLD